jgi:hypothetical protein
MMGGRPRRTQKAKKLRGGMGYGFGGTVGTAGPEWKSSWGGEVTKSGTPVYDTLDPQRGQGRRKTRKGRKASRKSKKTRKTRKMRGGAPFQRVAGVGYGYEGTGSRGIADAIAYPSKVAPSGAPPQNPDGVFAA